MSLHPRSSPGQAVLVMLLLAVATTALIAQQNAPIFRSSRELISIDVVVRDRDSNIVRGLEQSDFEVREDGRLQEVMTFSVQEVGVFPASAQAAPADLLARAEQQVNGGVAAPASVPDGTVAADAFAGRRLILLLFDTSSMQPEEVQRAVDSARDYVRTQMVDADTVAVATIASTLEVLSDFTGDREQLDVTLGRLAASDGLAIEAAEASTVATDEAAATEQSASTESSEFDMFNNDVRLRALRALAETLAPIGQKKAILYFSGGMQRSGQDNLVELRAAINAAIRAHVAIYPVDSRGLQAVVPGGDARQASGRGQGMFSGRGVAQQFARLASSQDTLTSLAADTGGRAFTDTNDFSDAFVRVQRDMSSYYLLGYSSTNTTKDGRFRRVEVRVKKAGYRVEARPGYYAPRDFAHTSRSEREAQLQEQLAAEVSATDVPVLVRAAFFRIASDRYYVPISVAIPGGVIPLPEEQQKATVDVAGMIRDEQGRPVGRIRHTIDVDGSVEGRQLLYQSGVTLPPGRFAVKVVVRENVDGAVGSFEVPVVVPDLEQAPLKVSAVVLSTQVQSRGGRSRSDNPLLHNGIEVIPNVTHVVGRDQKLFFYFEVYEPGLVPGESALDLVTTLAFYRGKVKVLETPSAERVILDAPDRKAAIFRLEVRADAFTPGVYTCQVNIIDSAAGQFAFPRLVLLVR